MFFEKFCSKGLAKILRFRISGQVTFVSEN